MIRSINNDVLMKMYTLTYLQIHFAFRLLLQQSIKSYFIHKFVIYYYFLSTDCQQQSTREPLNGKKFSPCENEKNAKSPLSSSVFNRNRIAEHSNVSCIFSQFILRLILNYFKKYYCWRLRDATNWYCAVPLKNSSTFFPCQYFTIVIVFSLSTFKLSLTSINIPYHHHITYKDIKQTHKKYRDEWQWDVDESEKGHCTYRLICKLLK